MLQIRAPGNGVITDMTTLFHFPKTAGAVNASVSSVQSVELSCDPLSVPSLNGIRTKFAKAPNPTMFASSADTKRKLLLPLRKLLPAVSRLSAFTTNNCSLGISPRNFLVFYLVLEGGCGVVTNCVAGM